MKYWNLIAIIHFAVVRRWGLGVVFLLLPHSTHTRQLGLDWLSRLEALDYLLQTGNFLALRLLRTAPYANHKQDVAEDRYVKQHKKDKLKKYLLWMHY